MKRLETLDFLGYRFLSQLELAPGGKHAAFVVSQADWEDNGYKSDIHILDVESETIRRLTALGDGKAPLWLDEGRLLFPAVREKADKDRVAKGERMTVYYQIDIHGGEAVERFRLPLSVKSIKKLDENTFALVAASHPDDPDFAVLDDAGKAAALKHLEEEKDYEVLDEIPFWYNGAGFTNKRRNRLYVYTLDSNQLVPVTDELTEVTDYQVADGKIAFAAQRFEGKLGLKSGAYVYDIATGATETLLPPERYEVSFIDFWPGGYLIKATDHEPYGLNQNANFYTIKDGKLELFCDLDEGAGGYTNSDCRYGGGKALRVVDGCIYYSTVDHVHNALRKITSDGKVVTLCKQDDTFDCFDVAGGKLYYCGLGAVTLQELFVLEDGVPRKLSSFNDDVLADKLLSKPERFDAKGERDTVEGFVMKPVAFDPAKKYPAVLHIHGGPRTAFGDTFYHEMQLWANKGYFVLFCNPWGGDGRGDVFGDIRGLYGEVDYRDLMTFTDACLEAYPQIDGAKLAVTGGSYGGFMTNWIIGHTDRFCCAASQRSISNWVSKFCTTDIGYYFNADQIQATPWENHDKLWYHSPLRYADKAKTPTLFIHSEEDYRCWLPEGIQMFTALKYHGVDVRLCMFRGENHELSRSGKPKHRARRLEEIMGWFARYMD